MNILFISSEASPLAKSGGLADVVGELPISLNKLGCKTAIIMPKYSTIKEEYVKQFEFIANFDVFMGGKIEYCGIFKFILKNVTYYLIDHEKYFKRNNLYGYEDDTLRFGYFSRAAIEAIKILNLKIDILHCHDWHTGMIPLLYKENYCKDPFYYGIKTVFTVHNPAYQGYANRNFLSSVFNLSQASFENGGSKFGDSINYLKTGLIYSDKITTVSLTHAKELLCPEFSYGLDPIFELRKGDFLGIVNGIDYDVYNPLTDTSLKNHYSADNMEGKYLNKRFLQQQFHLKESKLIPVFGVVTRFTWQKGIDILLNSIDRLMTQNIQLIILGSGDQEFEDRLAYYQRKYPDKISVYFGYNDEIARYIYSGSDFYLMPSLFEPCGISQMIAMRYGSIPIVRETGGLIDTVAPYNEYTGFGTGFSFHNYSSEDFLHMVEYALKFYRKKTVWKKIIHQTMCANWSWEDSANKYKELYKSLLK